MPGSGEGDVEEVVDDGEGVGRRERNGVRYSMHLWRR